MSCEAAKASSATAETSQRELDAIKEQLDLPFVEEIPTVTARIVDYGPSNFEYTIELDKGTSRGHRRGDARRRRAAGSSARVVRGVAKPVVCAALTDPGFRVGVRFGSAGDIGVAAGRGPAAVAQRRPRRAVDDDRRTATIVVTSG